MASTRTEDDSEDFPIQDDLVNLLDLMDQFPIVDVDSATGRVISPRIIQDVDDEGPDDPFFDEGPSNTQPGNPPPVMRRKMSRADRKGQPRKLPVTNKEPVVTEPAKPVVKDTTDDIITPSRLLDIAAEIFGVERVDLQKVSGTAYTLIIHFPDFIINNANRNTHRIRDLFVVFGVAQNTSSWSISVSGFRSTMTVSEQKSGYSHSHLPTGGSGQIQNFCQGTSAFKTITTALTIKPTEGQWEMVLLSLTNYVMWESLEGGPHIKITSITSGESSRTVNYATELKRWIIDLPVDTFDMRTGLQINYSERLKAFYNEVSLIRGPRSSNNSTESVRQLQEYWNSHNVMRQTFKGKRLAMTIIADEGPEESSFVDQAVIDQYNSLLESYLTNFNKRIDYEYLHYRNRGSLGKIPTFEQADVDHYKATAGKDRATARARRKQGVVGRVNHIRKREDNRLGGMDSDSRGRIPC